MPSPWGNPHVAAPLICAANETEWPEDIIADSTKVRGGHLRELRSAINDEVSRRGLTALTWTNDPTITDDVTEIRKVHVDDLRTALKYVQSGGCPTDTGSGPRGFVYCPQDTSSCVELTGCTDGTGKWEAITADVTKIRAVHWNAIRTVVNECEATCICESDRCEYCADCGQYASSSTYVSCNCEDHCGPEGCGHYDSYYVNNCGSINSGGAHPFKSFPPAVPHDSYISWVMGTAVPGSNWSSYWSCKCSPFTWH